MDEPASCQASLMKKHSMSLNSYIEALAFLERQKILASNKKGRDDSTLCLCPWMDGIPGMPGAIHGICPWMDGIPGMPGAIHGICPWMDGIPGMPEAIHGISFSKGLALLLTQ